MLRHWMNRPLTMSPIRNALIYSWLGLMLNRSINHPWVTEANPDGLTGFPGYAVLFLSVGICTWLSMRENDWVREIKRQQKSQTG